MIRRLLRADILVQAGYVLCAQFYDMILLGYDIYNSRCFCVKYIQKQREFS